jgi:hypothetical protein
LLLTGDRKRAIEMGFRFASVRGLRPQRNFAGNAIDLRLSGDLPAARWRFDFVQVTQLRVYRTRLGVAQLRSGRALNRS